jgi:hypothetical protein
VKDIYDPLDLAEIHILDQSLPFPVDILRPVGVNIFDVWNPTEMVLPPNIHKLHLV